MKPKACASDEFGSGVKQKLRKYWPIRTVGEFMTVIALLGILFAALPSWLSPSTGTLAGGPVIRRLNGVNGLGEDAEDASGTALEDPKSLLKGNANIDRGILKPAREIDPKMIHAPFRRDHSRPTVIPARPGTLQVPLPSLPNPPR